MCSGVEWKSFCLHVFDFAIRWTIFLSRSLAGRRGRARKLLIGLQTCKHEFHTAVPIEKISKNLGLTIIPYNIHSDIHSAPWIRWGACEIRWGAFKIFARKRKAPTYFFSLPAPGNSKTWKSHYLKLPFKEVECIINIVLPYHT